MNDTSFSLLWLLGAVLVVLKAIGAVELSWFWVLLPFWIEIAVVFLCMLLAGLMVFVAAIVSAVISWFSND